MPAINLTKDKADIYNLKRELDGITGNLELLKAERTGSTPVPNGIFTDGWHPKKVRTSEGQIFEMRIAETDDGTRWTAINEATHLRFTLRGQPTIFKIRKPDLPLKATLVYKFELITERKG